MKILKAKAWSENLELTRPYSIAYETIDAVENVFVQIELENGIVGIGAGSPAEFVTGESMASCLRALDRHLNELVLNKDVESIDEICELSASLMFDKPAARAAIDIALYDALAKSLDKPLVSMLGRTHTAFPTSITIGIKSLEEAQAEAEEYVGRGFRILKVKTGKSVAEDIMLIRKLREQVDRDVLIRVDANQGYNAEELAQFVNKTAEKNVEFIEQPFPDDKDGEMMAVSEAIRANCAADESLHHPAEAERLAAEPHPFGIYNIKLMKCGGVYPALKIAHTAKRAGIDLMWGCMDESIISISAALHAALASLATKYLDLDGSLDLARDLVKGGFILKDGMMSVTDEPGLGVTRLND